MPAFIDGRREAHGGESIRRVLPITPSTYRVHAAVRDSERSRQDAENLEAVKRVPDGSQGRHGVRKVGHPLRREEQGIARSTLTSNIDPNS